MSLGAMTLGALALAIVLSCTSRLNVGLLALALAWIIGVYVGGLPLREVTAGFPIDLFLFAAHRTSHGFTADGRYLVPFLSLLAIPLAYTIAWLRSLQNSQPLWHALLTLLIYGLFFVSWHNMLLHIGFSYNYNLDLAQFSELVVAPQNWRYVADEIFRNTANLPLLWLAEAILLLPFFLWSRRRQPAK
jgi:hypothetical protein